MDPDKMVGLGFLAYVLGGFGMLHNDGLTEEQRLLRRLDEAESRAAEIAERRKNSPAVAAAERKRQRKAEKLRQIEMRRAMLAAAKEGE